MEPTKILRTRYGDINKDELSSLDRLGLAYCLLNSYQWDELFGPKPDGFDELPILGPKEGNLFHFRRGRGKHDYVSPLAKLLRYILGDALTSFYWCKFTLGDTEDRWEKWFTEEIESEFIRSKSLFIPDNITEILKTAIRRKTI